MRRLFATDFHINIPKFNQLNPDGYPGRFGEFSKIFNWLKLLCEEKNVDIADIGGDIYQRVTDKNLMPFFNLIFESLTNLNVPLSILDGNHDKYDEYYKVNAPLKKFGHVWNEIAAYYDHNLQMRMVQIPFQRNTEMAIPKIKEILNVEEPTLIYMHQGVTGFGFPDALAYDPELFNKKHILAVFAGHYHFAYDSGKVHSPGSLFNLTFGDKFGEKKYVFIYDTKKKKLEKYEVPNLAQFLTLKQADLLKSLDKYEIIASNTYLRVLVGKGQDLKVPASYLAKFKGFVFENEKELKTNDKNEIEQGVEETQFQPDYTQVEDPSLDLSNLDVSNSDIVLTPDDFENLILKYNKDPKMVEVAGEARLKEKIKLAYLQGV